MPTVNDPVANHEARPRRIPMNAAPLVKLRLIRFLNALQRQPSVDCPTCGRWTVATRQKRIPLVPGLSVVSVLVGIGLFLATHTASQAETTDAPPPPADAGIKADSRHDLSPWLAEMIADSPVPGLAAAVLVDGEIVASGAAGVRMAGDPTPVLPDDRFHLGSCTKSMTASVAAMLVEDGAISWDRTVADAFPDLDIHPSRRAATLRQLLSNTGSTPKDVPGELWRSLRGAAAGADECERRMALVAGILATESSAPPGTRYEYSNAGFSIAGAMLEKAAGLSYAELLKTRLFAPLGMDSAGFGAPASRIDPPDQPVGHKLHDGEAVPSGVGARADNPDAISPAGRVHASIGDFARYALFHLGSHPDLLPPAALQTLHQPAAPANDYALGWAVVDREWAGGKTLTHSGSNLMNYAVMWLAPGKKSGVVIACNMGGDEAGKLCDRVAWELISRWIP